jgi:hypothetical protein
MRNLQMLAGSLVAAMGSLGSAPSGAEDRSMREHESMVAKIAAGFVALAGGPENAFALVASLREGIAVQLVYPGPTPEALPRLVPIEPPTGPMDWSDVRMTLMLARDALTGFGVLRPSPEQLHAALLGGEVAVPGARTVAFRGVLCMRAEGLGWGRIASERYQRPAVSRIE